MNAWGWRVPLLVGCAIIPFLFRLRHSLRETDEFLSRRRHPTTSDVLRSLAMNARLVTIGTMMVTMTTVSFYMITAYTPTFGSTVLKLASIDSLMVTLCVGVSNLIWLPVMGALSDRVGRRPLLIACTLLMLASAYPAMRWLVDSPSFSKLLTVELWFSFVYGSYNGAMVVFLTEIMPVDFRTAGFSLAYSLAAGIFGGFTPAVSTYLIQVTGNRAIPGLWLSFAAACGLAAAMIARPQSAEAPSYAIPAAETPTASVRF
jgi:MHS family citrate/tricarballylate:H+ symporter-like MFS transporter